MSEPIKDSVEYIANKFAENPGHFAATILKMYWDMEKERDQYKSERDILTDDLSRYKAKVSKLEQRHSKLVGENTRLQNDLFSEQLIQDEADDKIKKLERENEKLRVKSDSFFESWRFKSVMYTDLSKESDKYKSLLSEFSQHIGNKPSSSTYKYFRAKLDELGIEEGE